MSKVTTLSTFSYLLAALALLASMASHYFGPFDLDRLRSMSGLSGGKIRSPVVVAVMTRSHRLQRRQMIRQSWKQLLFEDTPQREAEAVEDDEDDDDLLPVKNGIAEFFFVTAERPCAIDPYWRFRRGACKPWNVFVPANVNEGFAVREENSNPVDKSVVRPTTTITKGV